MKIWVETVGIVAGLLLMVTGITTLVVTGLDLRYALGAVPIAVLGAWLVWRIRGRNPVAEETATTTGRAVQRPVDASEQAKSQFRNKI